MNMLLLFRKLMIVKVFCKRSDQIIMFSVFTLKQMIAEAIKRDEELIECINEGYTYTIQDLFKALQISLDCLKVYQKINDEAVKQCDVLKAGD